MGRAPCCAKVGLHKGPWTPKEDALLTKYIQAHGEGQWKSLPKKAGLLRCGKSCRLRWMNYLRPDIKRGNITQDEDDLIIRMHSLLGNRWSLIAGRLPGRTDNEIKNYWNTYLCKKLKRNNQTFDPTSPNMEDPQQEHKEGEAKKKKKKKSTNKKKNDKSKDTKNIGTNKEDEKIQVYLPKPIRVKALSLPRTNSVVSTFTFDSNSSIGSQEKQVINNSDNNNININNNNNSNTSVMQEFGENDVGFGFSSDDHDLVNDQFEIESYFATDENGGTLEKLYGEYLQLLNIEDNHYALDSFAESFFE